MKIRFLETRRRRRMLSSLSEEERALEDLQSWFDGEEDADALYDALRALVSVTPAFLPMLSVGLRLFPPALCEEGGRRRPLTFAAYIGAVRSMRDAIGGLGALGDSRVLLFSSCEIAGQIISFWSLRIVGPGGRELWHPRLVLDAGDPLSGALTRERLGSFGKQWRREPAGMLEGRPEGRLVLMRMLLCRNRLLAQEVSRAIRQVAPGREEMKWEGS